MRFWRKKHDDVPEAAEWQVRESRFHDHREGQPLDIAGRVAVCPRGHRRAIPTRFDRPVSELRCAECARSYPFPADAPNEERPRP
jgi:hypothetical protein